MNPEDYLRPVAINGTPAEAFATHAGRAAGIAKYFACTHALSDVQGKADENKTVALIAHCHAVADEPAFQPDGMPSSAGGIPAALRRLNRGNGLVGTTGASTERDYDMALKGLVVLAYRYPTLLGTGGVDFILDSLVPPGFSGGHSPDIEIVEQSFLNIDTPETENHLLMIETSRYLFNQLYHDRSRDTRFDNGVNGLGAWLLGFMQNIAQHDFLEFNSRPYQRLALHALLNLAEFARNVKVKTGAQILLDYTMTKIALSSNRGRRVTPFRRQQHRITHQANGRNYLYASNADQGNGFFLAYTGLMGFDGKPVPLPPSHAFNLLLAGTSAYRPPMAAYHLALDTKFAGALHRFMSGPRPRLPASPSDADNSLEIYYHTPSFLLSAGGQFLNSGYGYDEIDIGKEAWEQTSRAQATTLIPTKVDTGFHDLVRFEPYPDPEVDPYADDPGDPDCYHTKGVNIGVSRGLIAGANLRPAEKKIVHENSTSAAPALVAHDGTLVIAWKGTDERINVGRVQGTTLMKLDGVEGIELKAVLGETTDWAPSLASNNGRLFLAWKGSGNHQLNLGLVEFNWQQGYHLVAKTTLGDSSEHAPALGAHNGRVYLAWTGRGNEKVNVAQVTLLGNTAGGFSFELENKVVLCESSESSPALAGHDGRLYVAWKGSGNDALNLMFSNDGIGFQGKATFGETSSDSPALVSHEGRLFFAWRGSGNENLNVARVILIGTTAGGFGIEGLDAKVTLSEISTLAPALGSWNKLLFLAWKGEGSDRLNLRVSRDGSFNPPDRWRFCDLSHLGFFLAVFRAPPAHPDQLVEPLDNLGFVYAMETEPLGRHSMDFHTFQRETLERNGHLPTQLDYGGIYQFHAPDGAEFSIWFEQTGAKYQARVVDLSDPVGDFTTLPLVSGPHMNAPNGHDGLIEIRYPGAEATPLILDYRQTLNPERVDKSVRFPAGWLQRALAVFDLISRINPHGQTSGLSGAMKEGAAQYEDLVWRDPENNGPVLAPAVLRALRSIGVGFSVREAELREWLANPRHTPYPAIAQALLREGRPLKAEVFLDVIVFNYERAAGDSSPRRPSDVKPDLLHKALMAAYNTRHGAHVSRLAEIWRD